MRIRLTALVAAWAMGLAAQGQAPDYQVRVELDQPSTGTATFAVDAAGKVGGSLHIDAPNVVTATLSGTVKDGVWTFEFPYRMPDQNCEGVVSGTARVPADRRTISGTLRVGGACVDPPLTGSFSFTRSGPEPASIAPLPDTPQGRQVAAYFDAFNAGEAAFVEAASRLFTPGLAAQQTAEQRQLQYRSLRNALNARVAPTVRLATAQKIVCEVMQTGTGRIAVFTFGFESGAPYRINGLDIVR